MGLADWSDRLLSPERALRMAGDWPLTASYEVAELSQFENEGGEQQPDQWQVNLRCATVKGWKFDGGEANAGLERVPCGQSCGLLAAAGDTPAVTIGDLLSGVLRHMVTAHNKSLAASGGQ